nr:uncharacterized protein LOC113712504 isoform X2 [Coffea arabica]XP_027094339.1 uncharacterized protein LOC113714608 isoform X2 [Coffea arabica]
MATGTAAMAAMAARIPVSTWPTATRLSIFHGQVPKWSHRPRFSLSHSSISASSSPSTSRKLVLYSKPGCCLCDGLKEKLQAALRLSGPDSIQNVELQETLPRLSPRLGIELIQKKLAAALSE